VYSLIVSYLADITACSVPLCVLTSPPNPKLDLRNHVRVASIAFISFGLGADVLSHLSADKTELTPAVLPDLHISVPVFRFQDDFIAVSDFLGFAFVLECFSLRFQSFDFHLK